jgi:type IV pilus assembly protein PilY1
VSPSRPRFLRRFASGLAALAAASCFVSPARAQLDVSPPLPNVLLLIDSSGSMERMADGTMPTVCKPSSTANSDLNKWASLVSVLTGTVKERGCFSIDRTSSDFKDEYSLSGVAPYDYGYATPHHRIVSNNCVAGPGTLGSNAYEWPTDAIKFHEYNNRSQKCSTFDQSSDGILDAYRDTVRFAVMTYDSATDKGTGVSGDSSDATTGFDGQWSYFLDWNKGGSAVNGYPPGCKSSVQEVGSRNQGAPPWEGRLIAPGPPEASLDEIHSINDQIQLSLLAMRPYGATPIAGQLADALVFLRTDKSKDPLDSSRYFAPAGDGYTSGGCRANYVILLSDGEPNLDLRPFCEESGGSCPFKKPHEIAHDLAYPSDPKNAIKVYTVGFGVSNVSGTDCRDLKMPGDFETGGKCVNATGSLAACCTLSRIAYEGGTEGAYFADDITELKTALANVLSQASSATTSRTTPVYGSASGLISVKSNADAVAWEFTSSFNTKSDKLWTGNLERHRWQCKTVNGALTAELQDVDTTKGDDYAKNINSGKSSKSRRFITVLPNDAGGGARNSIRSIRPNITVDDGAGTYSGTVKDGEIATIADVASSYPKAFDLDPMPAGCSGKDLAAASPGDCGKRLVKWLLGGSNGGDFPTRDGDEFGAIYRSNPAVSTPPVARLRDADYELFASNNAARPVMLYSVTTDGQLHAHKIAATDSKDTDLVDSVQNNELWSFLPPYVLPQLLGVYPNTQKALLDGTVVVKDIPFERTLGQAKASGTSSGAGWATVLVGGGGSGGGYYYALDVTTPKSPKFLWQLSTNKSGDKLFGDSGGTPAIAMISVQDGTDVKETAVALLPGGTASKSKTKSCVSRKQTDYTAITGKFKPRSKAGCFESGTDRMLYVVRLSDGKILRVFGDDSANLPANIDTTIFTKSPFDAPLTGVPVAYPNSPGQVSNRAFVGDAGGAMYRFDFSAADSSKWKAELIWDAFSTVDDKDDDAQAVQGWPVLSVDELGNLVIIYSTGDQELLNYKNGAKNRLWSITEKPVAVGSFDYTIEPNWYLPFSDGKRVTGPIAVFDGVAYFATYTPAAPDNSDACSSGFGSVWGVSYKVSEDKGAGPRPLARLPKDPDAATTTYTDEVKQEGGSVVYGLSIQMEPSCIETSSVNDPYAGTHTALSNSSPPRFNLLFHTGNSGKSYGGNSAKTKASTVRLGSPKNQLRFDSWASVAE